MKCRDLMKMELEWVPGSASVLEAARQMRDRSVGFLLVAGPTADTAVGVVTDRDLVVRVSAEGLDPAKTRVGDVATEQVVTCNEDEPLAAAEQSMAETQKSRLAVVDDAGRIVGVLSLTDILRGDRTAKPASSELDRQAIAAQAAFANIHLTPSTEEDEEEVAHREHVVTMGAHRGSMKEFPG